MNNEHSSPKRQTIHIKVPRKPAAPRHSAIVARTLPLPNPSIREQATNALRLVLPFALFPIIQMLIAMFLAAMVLDQGECFLVVFYAVVAYLGGLCLMIPRRQSLTTTDAFLIRWGFVFLCIISALVSSVIWPIRYSI